MLETISLRDKPTKFPGTQINGGPLKDITRVLLERRATKHFKPDPVPGDYLQAILEFAAQAPSGFNLQPWRFVVVRDPKNRKRLQKAAMDQGKVGEAPVVIIAFSITDEWRHYMDGIIEEGARRGAGSDNIAEVKDNVISSLEQIPPDVWLNRHTMIAVTTMMLVAEAYGLDTAPMEGFDAEAVKQEFNLPADSEVIALLAIGYGEAPDKPYPGRFGLEEIVSVERYGEAWRSEDGFGPAPFLPSEQRENPPVIIS